MGSNSIKVISCCKSEQHRGAPWKLNKELTWTNHFGVSLRSKPQCLLGMSGTGLWPSLVRSRQWFFMLKGIFYLIYYLFLGCLGTRLSQLCFFPIFLYECPCSVNVLLKFISHHIGTRQLQVRCSLKHWMFCRPPSLVFCFNRYGLSW